MLLGHCHDLRFVSNMCNSQTEAYKITWCFRYVLSLSHIDFLTSEFGITSILCNLYSLFPLPICCFFVSHNTEPWRFVLQLTRLCYKPIRDNWLINSAWWSVYWFVVADILKHKAGGLLTIVCHENKSSKLASDERNDREVKLTWLEDSVLSCSWLENCM